MMRALNSTHFPAPQKQSGVTLLVAIIFLLVITVLGISSMRGVSLESRITANLKLQKILTSAAEAGLRMGETSDMGDVQRPCDASRIPVACMPWKLKITGAAADATVIPVDSNMDTPARFTASDAANVIAASTEYNTKIQWYVVKLNIGGLSMGNGALTGKGGVTEYYEVNSCASTVLCTSDTTTQRVILRSVVARSN
jgi:type IV pilus assembly protein PilX